MKNYQVITIPSSNNDIRGELGLTPERADFLLEKVREEFLLKDSISYLLEELTGLAENINESAFISYLIGRFHSMAVCRGCKPSSPKISVKKMSLNDKNARDLFNFLDSLIEEDDD